MSKKTITKNRAFVILLLGAAGVFSGCSATSSSPTGADNRAVKDDSINYAKPSAVGTIKTAEITESSGIVASQCQTEILWTHNDSGDGAFLYAINPAGEKLGTWKVANAKNVDWEDIAAHRAANGECFLYVGDIGDNAGKREELTIYRIREPQISAADKSSSRKKPRLTEAARAIKFAYKNGRFDAETLLVHPQTADIYVLTKRFSGAAGVYKLGKNYATDKTNQLEKIADFTVPAIPNGFLTGGDISADGRRVVVCDYFSAYEITLPAAAKNFDDIWRENPVAVELGEREQGEAVSYSANAATIYATSEKKNSPIIEVRKK